MMISKFKYNNWGKSYPQNIIEYMMSPCPYGLRIVNFLFQKIFRINSDVKFMVHFTSRVSGKITLGKNVVHSFANSGSCYIQGINGIEIGDETIFAPGVKIISANHDIDNLDKHVRLDPVKIGRNCWLGANAIILPGVKLGDNVIVGAGSVVTKSFDSNLILVGVPAKAIKKNNVMKDSDS